MIKKSIKRLPRSEVEVTVAIPWSVVQTEVDRHVEQATKDVVVPGFRPGKAPQHLLLQQIDRGRVHQRVLEEILPKTLVEVLKGEDIIPLDHPRYVITQNKQGEDLIYRATIAVRPTVEIEGYAKIRLKPPKEKRVEEKDIQKILTDAFQQWKKRKKGDPKPSDPVAPDDAFAQAIGGKDLATLRQQIRKELEARYRYEKEKAFEDSLLDILLQKATIDLPGVLVEDELNRIIGRIQQLVRRAGKSFEEYLTEQKKSVEELRGSLRPQAERNVRIELLLQHIGQKENIEVSREEITAQLPQDTGQGGDDRAQQEAIIAHIIRQAKTLKFLKEKAAS